MDLRSAREIAEWYQHSLAKRGCQVTIAGSIRREAPNPKDIELVALPKWSPDLAGDPDHHNLDGWIADHVGGGNLVLRKGGGPQARYYQLHDPIADINLDLFVAQPNNHGLILMIRTGSADFSHGMARQANRLGYHFHHGYICTGYDPRLRRAGQDPPCRGYQALATPTEFDVFNILEVRETPPPKRIGYDDVRPR